MFFSFSFFSEFLLFFSGHLISGRKLKLLKSLKKVAKFLKDFLRRKKAVVVFYRFLLYSLIISCLPPAHRWYVLILIGNIGMVSITFSPTSTALDSRHANDTSTDCTADRHQFNDFIASSNFVGETKLTGSLLLPTMLLSIYLLLNHVREIRRKKGVRRQRGRMTRQQTQTIRFLSLMR